jgi:hypothetical protein
LGELVEEKEYVEGSQSEEYNSEDDSYGEEGEQEMSELSEAEIAALEAEEKADMEAIED